ncbi:hypothetical protein STEG23_027703 [Scotinomys teguina]
MEVVRISNDLSLCGCVSDTLHIRLRPSPYLPTALILALWLPQGSQAALHIQKIPEQPQKNQDLLLSLHGVPSTVQDFIWYLGEETNGGTRLFSYIPGLPRPQRDGNAIGQRDIVGFPNGSMLLRGAQPSDSGTYQVAITINPSWTMKAKTEVQVPGDSNIYEVMPSPVFLVSPISGTEPVNSATSQPPLPSQQAQSENQHYQELLNPDPAPYCQLVPTS